MKFFKYWQHMLVGIVLVAGTFFGGYKLGQHNQLKADGEVFSDYLDLIQQQDIDACRDTMIQLSGVLKERCQLLIEEQCGSSKKPSDESKRPEQHSL